MGRLADFSHPETAANAGRSGTWRQEVAKMRARIEKERTPAGKEALAIKTGAGGIVDAEFIAQTLCLAHGWQEPNTLRALVRARDNGALSAADADVLIENYRKLRRVEAILRRWSYEGETELPDEAAPMYRVAIRCGFTNAGEFQQAVARYRECIRRVYGSVMTSN
jgi:glutamate-ammonia-ligase adenylyltransferase